LLSTATGSYDQFWKDDTGGYHYDFFYSSRDSGKWSTPVNISHRGRNTNVFDDASIVVDRLGRPHVALHYGYNPSRYDGAIYHCYKDGDTWTRPVCLTPAPRWENLYPSLVADRQGQLHLAWSVYQWGTNQDTVYYTKYDTAWGPTEVVCAPGTSAGAPCIALDSSDTPWVVFPAGPFGGSNDVYCAHRDSAGWNSANISNTPENCFDVSITIDRGDHLYVVWSELVPIRDIFLRTYDGHAWSAIQNLTNDTLISARPQLAFPAGDRIDLVWSSFDPFIINEVVYMGLSPVVSGTSEHDPAPHVPHRASKQTFTYESTQGLASGFLFSASGRIVKVLGVGSGDAAGLPGGIYFLRQVGSTQTQKLVMLR
jgi:hypothetical protein